MTGFHLYLKKHGKPGIWQLRQKKPGKTLNLRKFEKKFEKPRILVKKPGIKKSFNMLNSKIWFDTKIYHIKTIFL